MFMSAINCYARASTCLNLRCAFLVVALKTAEKERERGG